MFQKHAHKKLLILFISAMAFPSFTPAYANGLINNKALGVLDGSLVQTGSGTNIVNVGSIILTRDNASANGITTEARVKGDIVVHSGGADIEINIGTAQVE